MATLGRLHSGSWGLGWHLGSTGTDFFMFPFSISDLSTMVRPNSCWILKATAFPTQLGFKRETFLGILAAISFVLTCSMFLILVQGSLKNNFNFLLILFIYLKIWFFFLTTSKCCWILKATASKLKKDSISGYLSPEDTFLLETIALF